MTTMQALKAYFNNPPLSNQELLAFVKAIPLAEREEFGKAVCALLGEEWTPATK